MIRKKTRNPISTPMRSLKSKEWTGTIWKQKQQLMIGENVLPGISRKMQQELGEGRPERLEMGVEVEVGLVVHPAQAVLVVHPAQAVLVVQVTEEGVRPLESANAKKNGVSTSFYYFVAE